MAHKDDLGRAGEQLAVEHLTGLGWRVVDRNWRCRQGEIDIVAEDGSTTVMVEVKTRSSVAYGHPFDAITPRKLARLRRLAGAWCEQHPATRLLRLDVIGVVVGRQGTTVDHLRGVV